VKDDREKKRGKTHCIFIYFIRARANVIFICKLEQLRAQWQILLLSSLKV